MIDVVTWKWGNLFGPEYVYKLSSMLARHLHVPYRLNVITDDPKIVDCPYGSFRTLPMFTDHAEMKAGNRACFRRLCIFDRDMATVIGPRILQLDLDVVITGDVTPLFDRTEPLMLVEQRRDDKLNRTTYNPSMLLMDAGILHDLWAKFHAAPKTTWETARGNGWACSDMSVINDYLHRHPDVPRAVWTREEGVTAYWREVRRETKGPLPNGARVVLFYGQENPSDKAVQERSPWVKDHWL
jgi:hypothetical protein